MKSGRFAIDQWSASADSDEMWIEAGIRCTVTALHCFPLKSSDSGVDRAFPLRRKQTCSYDP